MPAGAVLHKAHQHVPVEQHTARHRQIQPARRLFPAGRGKPAAAQRAEPHRADALQNGPHEAARCRQAHRQLRTGSRQKAHRSGKGQHSGQRLTAADCLGFSGAVPTDEHCGQHHRAQCRIAPPHRTDRTQPGHGIGTKGKICPAGDAQRSGQENRKQNQCIHQRSSIGLYFWRTPRYL